MSAFREPSGRSSLDVEAERLRYASDIAQAAHDLGLRQRAWASPGQALLALVTAPVWLLGWAVALSAGRAR